MTKSAGVQRRAALAVGLLTIAWILAILALVGWLYAIGIQQWAAQSEDTTALDHQGVVTTLWLAFVAVGGAVLIAAVAFATRLPRTGVVYVVLAFVLGALVLPATTSAARTLIPPPPPPSAPVGCQEHSGGEAECPGN